MSKQHLIYIISGIVIVLCIVGILCIRSCGSNVEESSQNDIVKTDTLGMMVMQIQRCSRLTTAEYKIHKIITHEDESHIKGKLLGKEVDIPISVGERKVAIPMYATVKASIDLSQVKAEDIVIDEGLENKDERLENKDERLENKDDGLENKKIEIFLPQPEVEITETHIDHDGIKQHVALLRKNFTDKELLNYEQQGRTAIEKDIPNMNIMEMAKESAARQLIPIITKLGYKEENITISFRTDHAKILRQNK